MTKEASILNKLNIRNNYNTINDSIIILYNNLKLCDMRQNSNKHWLKLSGFLCVIVVLLCPTSGHCIPGGDWPAGGISGHDDIGSESYTTAYINVTYIDPVTKKLHTEKTEIGKYGDGKIATSYGVLMNVRSLDGSNTGCVLPFLSNKVIKPPKNEPWIALIKRGQCNFDVKVENAYRHNASAVIVYNDRDSPSLDKMKLSEKARNITAVFIYKWKGEELANLVDSGTRVMVQISAATHCTRPYPHINRTSVLFVSVSFIVLMIISLAWLVFYYVQRFRYMHAKDRLSRRLCNAAKKALSKIPTKQIQTEDQEVQGDGECCAVCIESYKVSDDLRILPCRHEFHKSCIDPWLLEHRTCPMCKMDILKHYGFVFTGSQESILQIDERTADLEDIISIRTSTRGGIQSEPASRVTTPDDFIPGSFPGLVQQQRTNREVQTQPNTSNETNTHCCACSSDTYKHILDNNTHRCCTVRHNCNHRSTIDPDKAQLLDHENFYDLNSLDSNTSMPVHYKRKLNETSHRNVNISKTYTPRFSQTYSSRCCHKSNNNFTDFKRLSHRRTVSCNDLKDLEQISQNTETQ